MSEPESAQVRISLNHVGHGTVFVDGKDLADLVCGLHFVAVPGKVSTVMLELRPDAIEFDGEAVLKLRELAWEEESEADET